MVAMVVVEVCGCNLEGVEEESSAAGVDVIGGDAYDDFTEGVLDGCAGGWWLELEGFATGLAALGVGYGATGCVVVVAEFFSAHGGRTAGLAVGQGVAAVVLTPGVVAVFDLFDELMHGVLPPPAKVCKVFETGEMVWYLSPSFRIKCKKPSGWPGFFDY